MPLSINVGLSRKASKDYQSTGYSINVTAELDQALLARPEELQQQIAALYANAHQALDRQAGEPVTSQQPERRASPPVNGNGRGTTGRVAPATESQKRAILAICRRLSTDAEYESEQLMGRPFAELSVKQASELIDELKTLERPPAGRNGGGR